MMIEADNDISIMKCLYIQFNIQGVELHLTVSYGVAVVVVVVAAAVVVAVVAVALFADVF